MAVSSTAFVLVALTGVGVAADHAVPGDPLYSVDRALESVGIGGDVVEERLQEAIVLASRGDVTAAATTASEAITEINRRGVATTVPVPGDVASVEAADTTDTTGTTAAAGTSIAAAAPAAPTPTEPETVDSAEAIRLAAEQLLQSVRIARSDPTAPNDLESAVVFLAEATATVEGDTTTTTSTSTSTSSTTTTTLERDNQGNGKGVPGGADTETTTTTSTTTTTVASTDDGSGATSPADGGDGSSGPIFLPTP